MAKPKKKGNEDLDVKILDVDASMQGTISFHDPVNLRINGTFDGKLDTKGSLSIGEKAVVNADITGDRVTVAGTVNGNIIASQSLSVVSPGKVTGNIKAPVLSVTEGAVINGQVDMSGTEGVLPNSEELSLKQVAQYLEVEMNELESWAKKKKIPAKYENNSWLFKKQEIDKWIQEEKIKV